MSDDTEEQANELLVLQSVYEREIAVADAMDTDGAPLTAFSIDVEVSLPLPVSVRVDALPDNNNSGASTRRNRHNRRRRPRGEADTKATTTTDCDHFSPLARDPRDLVAAGLGGGAGQQPQPKASTPASGPLEAARIRFLPPLHLALVLPPDYPSTSPPRFTLSAAWLDLEQLTACAVQLDRLWDEAAGCGIVFAWVEWLKHEAIETLGLCGGSGNARSSDGAAGNEDAPCLTLRPHGLTPAMGAASDGGDRSSSACDARVMAECEQPRRTLDELIRFSKAAEMQAFAAGVHPCPICLEEVAGADCVLGVGEGCEHVSCKTCLAAMVEAAVEACQADVVRCPAPECRCALPASLISTLVPRGIYDKWEALRKEQLLASLPGLTYCPRCDPASAEYQCRAPAFKTQLCKFFEASGSCRAGDECPYAHGAAELRPPPSAVPCLPVDDSDLCICPECEYNFCAACLEAYHPGSECSSLGARRAFMEAKEARMRQEGQGGSGSTRAAHAALRARLEEFKSLEMIHKTAKSCPGCKAAIERTEGCNHMQCRFCATHFCWQCHKIISATNPYDHFREPNGCVVFPEMQAEMMQQLPAYAINDRQRNEDQLAWRQLLHNARGAGFAIGEKRCPFCGALNAKVGNSNHMRCHHCRGAFCFLCRGDLRRGTRGHFTAAHPQHSWDEGEAEGV